MKKSDTFILVWCSKFIIIMNKLFSQTVKTVEFKTFVLFRNMRMNM